MFALAQRQAVRPAVRCRDANQNGVVTTSTSTPVAAADAKIDKTLDALNSLLPQAPPPPKPVAVQQPRPAAPAASQGGTFDWPSKPAQAATPASRPAAPRKALSFDQVMGFDGLAPELINARAAMIGFIAAFSTELSTGESVFAQLLGGGAGKALIVFAAVTLASFAPAIRGIPLSDVFNKPKNPKDAKAFGPFAPDSELNNGRLAMIGLAIMLLLEGTQGTAFFL